MSLNIGKRKVFTLSTYYKVIPEFMPLAEFGTNLLMLFVRKASHLRIYIFIKCCTRSKKCYMLHKEKLFIYCTLCMKTRDLSKALLMSS